MASLFSVRNGYDIMNRLRERLSHRIGMAEVFSVRDMVQDTGESMRELYLLTKDADRRVSVNALWVFTHFDDEVNTWLAPLQDELISRVLSEDDTTCRRLMLTLLLRLSFNEDTVRTDLLDFCLKKITATSQPYAIRALCMKMAYEQCRFFPELREELAMVLDMLQTEHLSPGLLSAYRQVRRKLRRHK